MDNANDMKDESQFSENVEDVLKFADNVINEPGNDLKSSAKLVSPEFAKKFMVNDNALLSYALFAVNPIIYTGTMLIRNHLSDKKKKQQQKELLMRKVMAKQQDVIQKMQLQQEENERKIKNLKAVIDLLDDTKDKVEEL
ncbi:MAG: hypothetical protein KBT29_02030 [Prevotellaceae bacterium]|nr:hypothetical protein [Candidatus Minthosoma caballi]